MHPVFSLVQLYFIFKYGNVIVNKNRWLARFAFSHCISSCFSFWIHTLLNETLDAIVLKYFPQQLGDGGYSGVTTTTTTTEDYRQMETYFEDAVTYAGYDWTACAENGTGIGNNMRCVVSTATLETSDLIPGGDESTLQQQPGDLHHIQRGHLPLPLLHRVQHPGGGHLVNMERRCSPFLQVHPVDQHWKHPRPQGELGLPSLSDTSGFPCQVSFCLPGLDGEPPPNRGSQAS